MYLVPILSSIKGLSSPFGSDNGLVLQGESLLLFVVDGFFFFFVGDLFTPLTAFIGSLPDGSSKTVF